MRGAKWKKLCYFAMVKRNELTIKNWKEMARRLP
jgi:hypothetical protein